MVKIPTKHKCWLTFKHKDKEYKITSPEIDRSTYYLYEMEGKEATLLSKGNNPAKLEQKVCK